jgi:TonB family protein
MKMLFSPLPDPKPRRKLFLTSMAMEGVVLLFAIYFNVLFPPDFVLPAHYTLTSLVAYEPPVPQKPQPEPLVVPKPVNLPQPPPPVEAQPVVAQSALPPLPKPKPPEKKVSAPVVHSAANRLPEFPAARSPLPKVVATDTFSTGSSATPTTHRPATQVQTGGFGDPNGVPARPTNGNAVNINARGSWDLPGGPGRGNGLGGSKGVPGVVASAGFGSGVAIGSPKGGGGGGTVQTAGFGDAKPAAAAPQKLAAAPTPTKPVEIVYKPKPDYTPEGRTLKIEGEVRLEVLFTAAGQVRVVRVLQGLGHGLDEQAVRAAEQIKFKPAQRQGQAVDYSATLHIIFQLA